MESVLAQTYKNYEILVIDDGSTDNTTDVLRPFQKRIRYIHHDNRGLAYTRNRGIHEARGEWVAFLDSDDVWLPTKLEVQMQAIRCNPTAVVHVTNATIFREHLQEEVDLYDLKGFRSAGSDPQTYLALPLVPCVTFGLAWMQCALVRKATFLVAGEFNAKLRVYLDFEMGARLSLIGPWVVDHRPMVRILRQDEGQVKSISAASSTKEGREELIEAYRLMGELRNLSPYERNFIKRRESDARSSLGLRLVLAGNLQEARQHLLHAFLKCKRPTALIKALLAYAPRHIQTYLIPILFPYTRQRP